MCAVTCTDCKPAKKVCLWGCYMANRVCRLVTTGTEKPPDRVAGTVVRMSFENLAPHRDGRHRAGSYE